MKRPEKSTAAGISAAADEVLSPYNEFSRAEWARLRADTPLTLTEADLAQLQGLNESVSLAEVQEIYLPLSRLLNLYVEATQELSQATSTFLGYPISKVPYIVGLAGSVAVGKSTTARILRALLSRWPNHPRVDLVTTDGFLFPNAVLEERGLMQRKGFPESYDRKRLLQLVSDLKAGHSPVTTPVYSHMTYDILPDQCHTLDAPDIVIVEGLNVLQSGRDGEGRELFVSDFFDFTVYVDASEEHVRRWYLERFLTLRNTAFRDPSSYFHPYAEYTDERATTLAEEIWRTINAVNLVENIQPTRDRARLILRKGREHAVERVYLRKI
ncbi:MAG: type I pantothenate kinase [Planctomycetota bacterium]